MDSETGKGGQGQATVQAGQSLRGNVLTETGFLVGGEPMKGSFF